MATYTPNYNLIKPDYEEPADVAQLNNNADLIDAALSEKQDTLTFDSAPTSGSANPVTSGGVYTGLASKAPVVTLADGTDLDTVTTSGLYCLNDGGVNLPGTAVNGYILVISNTAGTRAKQLFSRHGTQNSNDFQTYVRQWNGAAWSDWVRLIDDVTRIPWQSTTTWSVARANAKMDIKVVFTIPDLSGYGSYSLVLTIDIPVSLIGTSPNRMFISAVSNDGYRAQVGLQSSGGTNYVKVNYGSTEYTGSYTVTYLYR